MTAELHSNGRPSKKEQLDIQEKLKHYFEKGVSATTTSQLTGLNIKTVCKYFEDWMGQIKKINDVEFLERVKIERERYIGVLDHQLLKLYELQAGMEKHFIPPEKIYNNKIIQCTHYKERLHLVNMICQIMDKKFELLSLKPKQKSIDVSKN